RDAAACVLLLNVVPATPRRRSLAATPLTRPEPRQRHRPGHAGGAGRVAPFGLSGRRRSMTRPTASATVARPARCPNTAPASHDMAAALAVPMAVRAARSLTADALRAGAPGPLTQRDRSRTRPSTNSPHTW